MQDLCILVRDGDGGVVAPYCAVVVGIVVAEFNPLFMCRLGHDFLSELVVECRNSTILRYWYGG